jgi:cytochrome bd-type quinol oxidase subunit 2
MKLQKKLAAAGAAVTGLVASAGSAFAQTTSLSQITVKPTAGYAQDASSFINTIVSVIFVVGALLTLAYLVMGGIQWITAAGDKSKTESARNHITSALIGLLILAAAFAIFQVIMSVLGVGGAGQTPFNLISALTA